MSLITPEPYELPYADDLKRLLGAIRASNGYHTDVGARVFLSDERLEPDDDMESCLIVVDPEEELISQNGFSRDVNLTFEIEAFVRVGKEHDSREKARTLMRRVLTDVRRAVLQGSKGGSWKSQPMNVTLEGRTLPVIEVGSQFQYGVQPVVLTVREEFQEI